MSLGRAAQPRVFPGGEDNAFRRQAQRRPAGAERALVAVHVSLAGAGQIKTPGRSAETTQRPFRRAEQRLGPNESAQGGMARPGLQIRGGDGGAAEDGAAFLV